TRDIPIILLSARSGEEARIEGLEAGANDYLAKPFSARELVARVQTQLAAVEARRLEEEHRQRLTPLLLHAPGRVAGFTGPDHRIEYANEHYQRLFGDRSIIGKAVRDAFPELAAHGSFDVLDGVYRSGEPKVLAERAVLLANAKGELEERVFRSLFQPMR